MESYFLKQQAFDTVKMIPLSFTFFFLLFAHHATLLVWHYKEKEVKDFISTATWASECIPNFRGYFTF